VDEITSPLVDEQDDEVHLGVVLSDGVGHLLHQDRLAGLGRRHDQPALPLAQRRDQVHHAHRQVARGGFQLHALVRVAGAQVVEGDAVLGLVRLVAVDALHLEQRQVPLALLGRAHLPQHRVAGAQVEALDLAGRDVDVVRAVQVVPVLRAEEAVPFRENLQHALAPEHDLGVQQVLLDAVDKVLLAEPRVVRDVEPFGHLVQLGDALGFYGCDVHVGLRMRPRVPRVRGCDPARSAGVCSGGNGGGARKRAECARC
jgi:hypothetical protein